MKLSNAVLLILIALSVTACSKKPDAPAPESTALVTTPPPSGSTPITPPPPPVTNCTGDTVMYSMPVDVMLATDVTKSYVIPGFEISCGDTLWVGIRNTGTAPGTPWTVILDQSAGGSVYYTVLNQTVTLHWNGGSHIYVDIEAVLK